MELREAIVGRSMVRRFDPARPVSAETITDLVSLAIRAPSAGFSQGWDYLALRGPDESAPFWAATSDPDAEADRWLRGISSAPALIVCLSDPGAYLRRYAEADKGWTDQSLEHWPVPYWDTDVAMGSMLILLGAREAGLGALFFGVPAGRHEDAKAALGIPADRRIVGVIALGHPLPHPKSPSLRRGRREVEQVLHFGRFGESSPGGLPDSAKMER